MKTADLTHPKYRSDIDGLRAIAVLSVVCYHAFPKILFSGFIGVDIFFVISGYLISSIIFSNLENNSFSFVIFYARRIKRIFPALLIVLVSTFIFGWLTLYPEEYEQLCKHIAGGAGFVANFVLWNESGYFDNAEIKKPLLHLWSLAIEEQFYIIWPLLLAFIWKKKWSFVVATATIAVISFTFNIFLISNYPVADFYCPISRFWELMVGGLLAYINLHRPQLNSKFVNAQSSVGVFLLFIGLIIINDEQKFPGWYGLLPVFGTFFMISAGPKAWFNKIILSNKIFVWFGLISYPLYLWHWPLLSFAHILTESYPSRVLRTIAVVISIFLAWLTFELIEKPIRFGNQNKFTAIILIILMWIMGCLGYNFYRTKELPFFHNTVNAGDVGNDPFFNYLHEKFYLCTPSYLRNRTILYKDIPRCFQSQNNDDHRIAIIGDSHAENIFPGLAEALPGINIVYYLRTTSPYLNNKEYNDIFKYIINSPSIELVIISVDWNGHKNDGNLAIELDKTIKALMAANKRICIVDSPDFSFDSTICKHNSPFRQHQHQCAEDINLINNGDWAYYSDLVSTIKNNPSVHFLNLVKYFCSKHECSMAKNGVLFFRDTNHLNIDGSEYVAKRIINDSIDWINLRKDFK